MLAGTLDGTLDEPAAGADEELGLFPLASEASGRLPGLDPRAIKSPEKPIVLDLEPLPGGRFFPLSI